MSFSKSHLFDPSDQITSSFAKVLAHPVRLDILRHLGKNGPCRVEYFIRRYPLSKATISGHLRKLRKLDMVHYKEVHPHIIYSFNRKSFEKYARFVQTFCQTI